MSVTLRLPSVLEVAVGADRVEVVGDTVGEALASAFGELPNLRRHLLQDDGRLRPHVLCLVNGDVLARGTYADHPVRDGDEIQIHQAISGG